MTARDLPASAWPVPEAADVAASLPPAFRVGVATAAPQIEGGVDLDGRGRSIWDDFADRDGVIADGSAPRVTTDHRRRWRDDLRLMQDAGIDAYRMSIAWPRVQPEGSGRVSAAGLGWYEELLDAVVDAGMRPMVTLFHWDLPAPLEARGGWLDRDTAPRLADYAHVVGEALGDRVADWVTVNEPATVTIDGYALGLHAPGHARVLRAIPAGVQLLRGHGLAVRALRDAGVQGRIGIVNAHTPVEPASERGEDRAMAALLDLLHNRLFADPVLLGTRPAVPEGLPLPLRLAVGALARIRRRDLVDIHQPIDFLGLNYYFPSRVAAGPDRTGASPDGESAAMRDVPFHLVAQPEHPTTGFGWPVAPVGLATALEQLRDRYGDRLPPVVITEQGASFPDEVVEGVRVDDVERTSSIARHLEVAARGVPGVTVEGLHVWTLVDNWEWAAGFTQRFGIVHLDRDTLERTPKRSYRWLQELQRARGRRTA